MTRRAVAAGFALFLLGFLIGRSTLAATPRPSALLAADNPAGLRTEAPPAAGASQGVVAVAPTAAAPTTGTVAPLCWPIPCDRIPTPRPVTFHRSVDGSASWFRAPDNQAAAGPGLRQAIGPGWRGTRVQVTANGRNVSVTLTDWCLCSNGKVIDLDDGLFARLAPLERGLVAVTVSW